MFSVRHRPRFELSGGFKPRVCSSGRPGGCGGQMGMQQDGRGGAEMLGPAPTNPSNPCPEQGICFFCF